MKTNVQQLKLSEYGLTEMSQEELQSTNGGGILGNVLTSAWGTVVNAAVIAGNVVFTALGNLNSLVLNLIKTVL